VSTNFTTCAVRDSKSIKLKVSVQI